MYLLGLHARFLLPFRSRHDTALARREAWSRDAFTRCGTRSAGNSQPSLAASPAGLTVGAAGIFPAGLTASAAGIFPVGLAASAAGIFV